jgi:hypothetical protein
MIATVRILVVVLLASSFLVAMRGHNQQHASDWEERRAQYRDAKIVEADSWLQIDVNSPRPLDDVLATLASKHGWRLNYEDPQYGKADLVYGEIAGGAFSAKIPIRAEYPPDPEQVIPAVVAAYNISGNSTRFELRISKDEWFDVVPTAAAGGPQTPILDTPMNFDATESVNANSNLWAFFEELRRQTGQPIQWLRLEHFPEQARIRVHAQNRPAREVLRQMLSEVGATVSWRVHYDLEHREFILVLCHYAW